MSLADSWPAFALNSEGRNGVGSSTECLLQWRQADAVMDEVEDRRKEGGRAKEQIPASQIACGLLVCSQIARGLYFQQAFGIR